MMLNQTQKHTIMIIDNEIGILHRFFEEILKRKGMNIITAFYLRALTILNKKKPDIVLLNANISKNSGLKILDFVKTNYPTLPVVVISSYGCSLTKETMVRLGATDLLYSPFVRDVVLSKIGYALQCKRKEEWYEK